MDGRLRGVLDSLTLAVDALAGRYDRGIRSRAAAVGDDPDPPGAASDRLESIIERIAHVVYVKDRDGRYVLMNSAGEALFDRPREEIEGRTDADLFGAEEAAEIREIDERVMADGEPASYESRRPVDGEDRVFRNEKYPYRPDGDAVRGVIGVSRDVTGEKERQRILERLHEATRELMVATSDEAVARIASETTTDVLDLPLNGVHLFDPEADALVPIAWSDAAESLLGVPPPDIPADGGLAWEVYEDGEPRTFADVRTAEGTYNTETAVRSELFLPLGGHGIMLIGSTAVDDFDAADEALAGVLAANVETALDRVERERELERQNERLSDFAGIVSHDLRNPLNVAEARLDLAMDECDSEHLPHVRDAHDRMGDLVEDVLSWARGGGSLEPDEAIDLDAVAGTAWESVDSGGATLVVEDDLTVEADLGRLRRVFENLFRNGIEHAGREVTIRIGRLPDGDGFYVEDDGPGIPADERADAFEPGYTTSPTGTGFGLPIVREIVAGHGWSIELVEGEAGGARFEVRGVTLLGG